MGVTGVRVFLSACDENKRAQQQHMACVMCWDLSVYMDDRVGRGLGPSCLMFSLSFVDGLHIQQTHTRQLPNTQHKNKTKNKLQAGDIDQVVSAFEAGAARHEGDGGNGNTNGKTNGGGRSLVEV